MVFPRSKESPFQRKIAASAPKPPEMNTSGSGFWPFESQKYWDSLSETLVLQTSLPINYGQGDTLRHQGTVSWPGKFSL